MHWLGILLLVLFAGAVALAWVMHPAAGLATLALGLGSAWVMLRLLPRGGVALRLRQGRRPRGD
jgi:hypothetical protein